MSQTLLEQYITEIAADLQIDEMNVKEVQLRLPARKHFWAARLIRHKHEKMKLEKDKDKLKRTIAAQTQLPIAASEDTKLKLAEANAAVVSIIEKIQEVDIIIELLEKTERIFASCTYDIGNIIKIQQMETL